MYSAVLTAAWIGAAIYATIPCFWVAAHPFAQRWRSRHRSPYGMLLACWVGAAMLLLCASWPWHTWQLYSSRWAWLGALPLFVVGATLYRAAMQRFTPAQLVGRPELQGERYEQRLVTSGVRARMRHPIYLGHLCNLLGAAVGTGLLVIYGFFIIGLLADVFIVRAEDRELEHRFGQPYRDYKRRVPAFGIRFRREPGNRPMTANN